MILSVVIVSYNVKFFLEQCLSSLKKAVEGSPLLRDQVEVFIVDNASGDGSLDFLPPLFQTFHFIQNQENKGFAKANNQALSQCCGEFLLFLNPDTILAEDTLDNCISFLRSRSDAGALGVHMLDGAGRFLRESKRGFPGAGASFFKMTGLARLFPRSKIFSSYYLGHLDERQTHPVDILSGAFLMTKKSVMDKTGGFDEQFFMYGEETDWCYRFKQAGWKVIFAPIAQIIHLGGASSARVKPEMRLQLSGSVLLFIKKHKNWVQYMFASLFTSLFFLMRIPYWSGVAVISKENRDIALRTIRVYLQGFFLSLTGYRHLCIKRTPRCDGVLTNERIRCY